MWGELTLIYAVVYLIMLLLTSIHLLFNWKVLHYEGFETLEDLIKNGPRVESYKKTIPWQPLYNIIVFGGASLVNFQGYSVNQVLMASLYWVALSILLDVVFWVFIPHPWSLTAKELYIGHQPYLTLCYLSTGTAPFLIFLTA